MANPYQVAIQLALASNHAGVLQALSHGLLGINTQVGQLSAAFSKLKGVIVGAIGVGVGVEMFSMLEKLIDKTKGLSHEVTQLRKLGISEDEISRVQKEAIRITGTVPGTTELDALKIRGQLGLIMNSEDSLKIMENMAKYQSVIRNTKGKFDENDEKDLYKTIRAADLIGKLTNPTTHQVDTDTLQKYLDIMSRLTSATHGQVSPQVALGLAQQGGPALMNLSDHGLMTMGMMSQVMGGPRAGTAMMSLFQQMAGGQMPLRTALGMEHMGMLGARGTAKDHDNADWYTDRGRVILSDDAKKRLSGLLGNDPLKFAEKMKSLMEDQGITSNEDQTRKLFEVLGRATSQRFMADLIRNQNQLEQERGRIEGALGTNAAMDAANKGDVAQNLHNLSAAWDNFQFALAGPNSENTISVLQKLTEAINALTGYVRDMDPEKLKAIGIGIGALAGAFVVGGAALMMAAIGTGGWLVVGLGTLFAVFEAFKPDMLKDFVATLDGIEKTIIGWGTKLRAFFGIGAAPVAPGATVPPGAPGVVPPSLGGLINYIPTQRGGGGAFGPPTQFTPGPMPFRGMRGGSSGGLGNAISGSSGGGGGGGAQPIIVSLNIDGRKISEALSSSLAEMMQFPTQAPYHDTYGGYASPDNQTATT